jgi:hypothetical protein
MAQRRWRHLQIPFSYSPQSRIQNLICLQPERWIMSEHSITLHQHHFSREKQVRFLEALSLWGSVRAACRAVPVSPQTVYRARRSSRDFALAWDAAVLVARPHVEDVLSDRALNGVEEAVYYHGEEIARRRRFDSRLLLAHLARLDKAEDRDEVREVAEGFDTALERLRRGEPVDPLAAEDDGEGAAQRAFEGKGAPWMDEALPFTERVLLYLDSIEDGEGVADADAEGDDEDDDGGAFGPEVSMEDIALLTARGDMAAIEAIHSPRSEDAWVEDGHAARLAAYRAEAEVLPQDRVTPVTLPVAEPGAARGETLVRAGPAAAESVRPAAESGEDARSGGAAPRVLQARDGIEEGAGPRRGPGVRLG